LRLRTSNCSLLLMYLPRKDERLSRSGPANFPCLTLSLGLQLYTGDHFVSKLTAIGQPTKTLIRDKQSDIDDESKHRGWCVFSTNLVPADSAFHPSGVDK